MKKEEHTGSNEIPFSWMLRSRFATKATLDTLFRIFGAKRVLPDLYYIRPLVMGSNFLDVREALGSIHSWEEWIDGWRRVGEKREIYGRAALEDSRLVTARENYLYASAAYQMAQFPLYDEVERRRELYARCAECYRYAAALFDPPCTEVTIRFRNHRMPGYLRVPKRRGTFPLVILLSGADSSKEEMHFFASSLLDRGVASLAFDGPGMGEMWEKLPMVMEYEKVGRAVINYLVKLPRIDRRRIGILGLSYGGNLALRIAAHDERIAAAITVTAPYDPSNYADFMLPLIRDQVKFLFRDGSKRSFDRWAKSFSLRGMVEKIRSPLLVIGGGEDVLIPPDDARKIFDEARCEKKLLFFEEGNHLCAEYTYDLIPRMEEWLLGVGFLSRKKR